jgi:23S rRNA (uridine2479-2'-O)-methyltransferase
VREVRIHSENNDFQHVETLARNRTKRQKSHEFFVEGVRNINQAVAHSFRIKSFFTAADARLSPWAQELIGRGVADTHFSLPPPLMARLSDKEQPSELVAVVGMPADDLSRITVPDSGRVVVLDRPSNPGNLGTLLRACDAFGVSGVVVSGHAVDLFDPLVVRASVGSFFAVPVVRLPSHRELLPWLEALRREPAGLRVLGTSAKATLSARDEVFSGRTVLVFGNETHGVSVGYRELCDDLLTIPMGGTASSLNVSCAASIVLYEAYCRVASRG